MMPFASNLLKYWTSEELEKNDGTFNNDASRSSAAGGIDDSFIFINGNSRKAPVGLNTVITEPDFTKREAVRIEVQCCVDDGMVDTKSMTVDPNITSFASLYLLMKRAFTLKTDFDISYLLPKSAETSSRPDVYLCLSSDWDLDAAFHTASSPILTLKIESVPKPDFTEWHMLDPPADTPTVQDIKSSNLQLPITMSLRHEVSKHLNKVFDVFVDTSRLNPLSHKEWVNHFDGMGRILALNALRVKVFHRGLEHSLRREAWVHLLGVFPSDLSVEERTRFLFMKTQVYKHLKEDCLAKNPREIESVTHMVQKDVLRTDRIHPYFNVPDDHPNLVSLYNILTTFAIQNPDISYCQGMSDLASPLLIVTGDETMAYLCFCKVMQRLRNNFSIKSTALMQKFRQLSLLLQRSDEKLYTYLQEIEGGNLYFCYRMLLLELKREFPFNEALQVMEVIWSSMPARFEDDDGEISFYYKLLQEYKTFMSGRSSPAVENVFRTNTFNTEHDNIKLEPLPHPRFLNDGSPFPLFLCLSILLINRDNILSEQMDYTILAMYFDKMSRKHNSKKVIARAKELFFDYIRAYLDGQTIDPNSEEQTPLESLHGTESTAAQC